MTVYTIQSKDERTSHNSGGGDDKGKCACPMVRLHSRRTMANDFEFTSSDLKHYPHFDAPVSPKEIEKLVTDKKRVAANKFYPFLLIP